MRDYYNNLTTQEPPADWSITPGEDIFFARRMAQQASEFNSRRCHLHGLEPLLTYAGKLWLRVGSLYPEIIKKTATVGAP